MHDTDPPPHETDPAAQPESVGTTLMDMGHHDPKALLPLLRLQLKKNATPTLLLKAANTAADATEWEEAAFYAKRLVLIDGNSLAMEILADALFELGRQADLDALWSRAAPLYLLKSTPGEIARPAPPACLSASAHGVSLTVSGGDAKTPSPPIGRLLLRLAQHLLKKGNIKEGLQLRMALRQFKSIMAHPLAADHSMPWWSETDADTPLLVLAEQALGEQVLWAAAFDELSQRYPNSIVECDERLIPIFSRSHPGLQFVSQKDSEATAIAAASYRKIPASELDYFLGTRTDKKTPAKWLKADAVKCALFREKYQRLFGHSTLVGVSWRSHVPRYGSFKSVSLSDLNELMNTAGFCFVSLQYGDTNEDMRVASLQGGNIPSIDLDVDAVRDIDTWSAQVAAMDVVITPSNTTAHMAAALGVPTILLLPSPVSVLYYWGYTGRSTPWYPFIVDIVRGNGNITNMINVTKTSLLRVAPPSQAPF